MELERALWVVADVLREGARTHRDGEWKRRPAAYHVERAEQHLRRLRNGDQREDNLAHAAVRLLMAVAIREVADDE